MKIGKSSDTRDMPRLSVRHMVHASSLRARASISGCFIRFGFEVSTVFISSLSFGLLASNPSPLIQETALR